jgi:hypothetical protein
MIDVGVRLQLGKAPRTMTLSGVMSGTARRISARESVSSSMISALPASDSDTFFIKVNFREPVSRN